VELQVPRAQLVRRVKLDSQVSQDLMAREVLLVQRAAREYLVLRVRREIPGLLEALDLLAVLEKQVIPVPMAPLAFKVQLGYLVVLAARVLQALRASLARPARLVLRELSVLLARVDLLVLPVTLALKEWWGLVERQVLLDRPVPLAHRDHRARQVRSERLAAPGRLVREASLAALEPLAKPVQLARPDRRDSPDPWAVWVDLEIQGSLGLRVDPDLLERLESRVASATLECRVQLEPLEHLGRMVKAALLERQVLDCF